MRKFQLISNSGHIFSECNELQETASTQQTVATITHTGEESINYVLWRTTSKTIEGMIVKFTSARDHESSNSGLPARQKKESLSNSFLLEIMPHQRMTQAHHRVVSSRVHYAFFIKFMWYQNWKCRCCTMCTEGIACTC
jgi:hypothetical protein